MPIEKVGVAGCGLMGSGIAQVCAQAGCRVVVREVSAELVDKGLKSIEKNLQRLVDKGTISDSIRDQIRGRLRGTTDINDFCDADLVIEAIIEQVPAKREFFAALDKSARQKPFSPATLPRSASRKSPRPRSAPAVLSACTFLIPCR